MLKTILSVTGKPGLFKLISSGKNMVIVESLTDKKRLPIYARDKVVSLADIAMYTETDEVPLRDVLISIKKKENGGKTTTPSNAKPEELHKFLEAVLPNYDKDRVYNADIKKLINWYNLLTDTNIDFEATEEKGQPEEEVKDKPTEKEPVAEKPKKETKPKAKKETSADKEKPKAAAKKTAEKEPSTKAKASKPKKEKE